MKKGLNAIFASALIISGCDLSTYSENKMEATIKITPYGVSHIVAKNYHGIGFGSGYAQARDHLCGLSDMFIRVNSKRSEYFGPDAFEAGDSNNLKSDFGYLGLQVRQHAVDNFSELSSNAKLLLSGYVNGYNKYLTEVSAKDEEANKHVCVQENWAMTIEPNDLLTYLVTFSLLGSSENFVDLLNYANPGDGQEWLPRIQPISPSANIAKG
ncbi:MAG: penicillin acylase family protein, partial [Gammaproteobacteria bacterium]|nr:penicillin acylase family protein [Gammaproteobacteria bacterium]